MAIKKFTIGCFSIAAAMLLSANITVVNASSSMESSIIGPKKDIKPNEIAVAIQGLRDRFEALVLPTSESNVIIKRLQDKLERLQDDLIAWIPPADLLFDEQSEDYRLLLEAVSAAILGELVRDNTIYVIIDYFAGSGGADFLLEKSAEIKTLKDNLNNLLSKG